MKYNELKKVIANFKGKDLALEIFRHSLIKQQKQLFDLIPFDREKAKTAKEIGDSLGITSANTSAQIRQLQDKLELIKVVKVNKKTKYYI